MLRYLACLLLLIALPLQAAGERLLFYQVEHGNAEIFLLGSMHLAPADIYPLRTAITGAFEAASTLVVEVDLSNDGASEIQQLMLTRGTYPAGETIRDHLTTSTWKDLERVLQELGLAPELMVALRPGFLVTTLSAMTMMQLGMKPELGIDLHFINAAGAKKRIASLETAEQQVNLLLDFPDTEILVRQTLESLDQIDALMEQLVAAWKIGDAPAIQKLILDDSLAEYPEFESVYERIFDQRNLAMTDKIEAFFDTRDSYFVVVGAGHLVGNKGIVSLLRKRGYTVKQL